MTFTLEAMQFYNWDYWPNTRLPFSQKGTIITGRNGSGKSSTKDAIRLALGAREPTGRNTRVDQYVRNPAQDMAIVLWVHNDEASRGGGLSPFRVKDEKASILFVYHPSKKERRFLVTPGWVDLQEVGNLLQARSVDWLNPEAFRRTMRIAGYGVRVIDQIVLGEGDASRFGDQDPSHLFHALMQQVGDPAILDEYRRQRERRETEQLRVDELDGRLERLSREAARHQEQKRLLDKHIEVEEKIEELHRRIEAARLQAAFKRKESASSSIDTFELHLTSQKQIRDDARTRAQELEVDLKEIQQHVRNYDEDRKEAGLRRDEAQKWAEKTKQERDQVEALQRKIAPAAGVEIASANADWSSARAETAALQNQLDQVNVQLEEAQATLEALRAGQAPVPRDTAKGLEVLAAAGIKGEALLRLYEPEEMDAAWLARGLGDLSHGVVVADDDHDSAVESLAAAACDIAVVRSTEVGLPDWFQGKIEGIRIHDLRVETPEATYGTRSPGLRFQKAVDPGQVDAAQRRLAQLEAEVKRLENEHEASRGRMLDAQDVHSAAVLREQEAEFLAKADTIIEVAAKAEHAYGEAKMAFTQLAQSLRDLKEQEERLSEQASTHRGIERDAEAKVAETTRNLQEANLRREEAEKEIGRLIEELGPALTEEARQGTLETIHTYESRIRNEREKRQTFGARPPDSVLDDFKRAAKERERFQEDLDRHRETLRQAINLNDQARRSHIRGNLKMLQDFRKRFYDTATIMENVEVKVRLPQIGEDASDEEYDQAGVEIRIGYNGKPPALLHAGQFSKGERALNGLMVLLSIPDVKGRGFFVLDEPYEGLDFINTAVVNAFLERIPHQVIFCDPTDSEQSHYEFGDVMVVLRRVEAGEKPAPRPLISMVPKHAA